MRSPRLYPNGIGSEFLTGNERCRADVEKRQQEIYEINRDKFKPGRPSLPTDATTSLERVVEVLKRIWRLYDDAHNVLLSFGEKLNGDRSLEYSQKDLDRVRTFGEIMGRITAAAHQATTKMRSEVLPHVQDEAIRARLAQSTNWDKVGGPGRDPFEDGWRKVAVLSKLKALGTLLRCAHGVVLWREPGNRNHGQTVAQHYANAMVLGQQPADPPAGVYVITSVEGRTTYAIYFDGTQYYKLARDV
jgi:hypothetical protein